MMNKLILGLTFLVHMTISDAIIFDFTKTSDISSWRIVDDGVMGGRSKGTFSKNPDGSAVFSGKVSLDNYGGFSSVQYSFQKKEISSYTRVVLRIKGDGKKYQFRIKEKSTDAHSYIGTFQTTSDWQTVTIPMNEMYPAYRGRTLQIGNLKSNKIEQVAFLIANKVAEQFKLEIAVISLR